MSQVGEGLRRAGYRMEGGVAQVATDLLSATRQQVERVTHVHAGQVSLHDQFLEKRLPGSELIQDRLSSGLDLVCGAGTLVGRAGGESQAEPNRGLLELISDLVPVVDVQTRGARGQGVSPLEVHLEFRRQVRAHGRRVLLQDDLVGQTIELGPDSLDEGLALRRKG